MRKVLAVVLILLVMTAQSALSAEHDTDSSYSSAFKACMDKAVSTMDTIGCIDSEYKVQDKRLNAAYKTLRNKQTPKRVSQLTEL